MECGPEQPGTLAWGMFRCYIFVEVPGELDAPLPEVSNCWGQRKEVRVFLDKQKPESQDF